MRTYSLWTRHSRKRGFVYLICSVIPLLFGFWAIEYEIWAAVPYAAAVLLLVFQFFRPTILGWFLSLGLFGSYAVGVFIKATSSQDYLIVALVGVVPTIALFWARPKASSS